MLSYVAKRVILYKKRGYNVKETLNIAIDADGVIFRLFEYQIKKGKEYFGVSDDDINLDGYDITEIFNCTEKEKMAFWKHKLNFYNYCMKSPLINDVVETIKKWRAEGHKVYNITARSYVDQNNWKSKLSRYLLEKRYKEEGIEFDGIDYCSEKESVRDKVIACSKRQIDIMLEDKKDNIEAISKIVPKVICFDWPYNRDCYVENMVRVPAETGFKEADKIIQEHVARIQQQLGDKHYLVDVEIKNKRRKKFKRLPEEKILTLDDLELREYRRERLEYYRSLLTLEEKKEIEKQEKFYKAAYHALIPLFRLYFNPQGFNKELIPYQKGLIFVANHLNYLDHFVLIATLLGRRPIHFLAASELLEMKRGILYKKTGCYFVKRGNAISEAKAFEKSIKLLTNGYDIFIFPEGTRNNERYFPKTDLLRLHDGATIIAQITGAPIIPMVLNDDYGFRSKTLFAAAGHPILVRPRDNIEKVTDMLTMVLLEMIQENKKRVEMHREGISLEEIRKKDQEKIEKQKKKVLTLDGWI